MSSLDVRNAINYANANAGGFVELAKDALTSAKAAVASVGYDDVVWNGIAPTVMPDFGAIPAAPTLSPVLLTLPDAPGDGPTLLESVPIDVGDMPTLSVPAPTLEFPARPSEIGRAPDAPQISTFEFPEPPESLSTELPAPPVFAERAEPVAPEIILPEFAEALPERLADAPTDGAEIMGVAYAQQSLNSQANADAYVDAWIRNQSPEHHTQMARLEARLATFMAGGTGLAAEVESGIFNRARERNDLEAARLREASYSEAANRGFTLPTGALMAGIARARQEAANNNLKAATDIAIAQAELEQKNLQFAVTTSAGLRTAMIGAALGYMGHVVSINAQAMDYAKAVFGNVVEMYNAAVRAYSARVDAYKGYVSIYESRIKAAMAKIEVYRAEIAALEALTNADQSRAAIYRIQIDSINSMVALYRARIEAVQGRVSLEKTKLEIFQAQTQAFGAQVQAKNAEWSGYNASISGEESKVRIYGAQLSAFNSQLDAYRAAIAAKIAESESVVKTNQANADMHSAKVRSYTALVGAESERARAENDNNRQMLTAFEREIAAFQAQTQLRLVKFNAESDAKIKDATSSLSAQIEMARAKTQYGATLAQLSNDGAQIFGTLAGAAMAGTTSLVAAIAEE